MRPIGTAEELERRRRRAIQLVREGEHPADVARFLGCGRSSVYTWLKWHREAPAEIAVGPHPGRLPCLTEPQLRELRELLLRGARAHGWRTELWTAARVAELIRRHFGVAHHTRARPQDPQAEAPLQQPEAAEEGPRARRAGHRSLKA